MKEQRIKTSPRRNEGMAPDEAEKISRWQDRCPLRQWRMQARQGSNDLAEKIGVHRNSVSYWEGGKVRPGPEAMAKLARVIGVSQIHLEEAWDRWMRARPQ